jgi:hypothetical protein
MHQILGLGRTTIAFPTRRTRRWWLLGCCVSARGRNKVEGTKCSVAD